MASTRIDFCRPLGATEYEALENELNDRWNRGELHPVTDWQRDDRCVPPFGYGLPFRWRKNAGGHQHDYKLWFQVDKAVFTKGELLGEVTVRLSFTSHLTRVNRNGKLVQKRSKSILGAKERPSHLHIEVDQGADERVLSKLADWAWGLLTGCVPLTTEEIISGPRGDKYQPPATIVSNPSDQPSPPAVQPLPASVPGPPPDEKWQKYQYIGRFWWSRRGDFFFEDAALPWTPYTNDDFRIWWWREDSGDWFFADTGTQE